MSRAAYLLALLLAACGGGGDDGTEPAPVVIQPRTVSVWSLDEFEIDLRTQVRAAPRPAVIASCGFDGAALARIRLVASQYGLGVLTC